MQAQWQIVYEACGYLESALGGMQAAHAALDFMDAGGKTVKLAAPTRVVHRQPVSYTHLDVYKRQSLYRTLLVPSAGHDRRTFHGSNRSPALAKVDAIASRILCTSTLTVALRILLTCLWPLLAA